MTYYDSAKSNTFVGRETELDQLFASLAWVAEHKQPKFVLVEGDYGVGKTALVRHFCKQAEQKYQDLIVAQGLCSMESESNGLIPFSQILVSLAGEGRNWKLIGDKVLDFTKKVAPAWLDIVTGGIASAVTTTVEESVKLGRSKFSQNNVFVQFNNALLQLTDKGIFILFIDDLHWADESSLRLLFHVGHYLKDRAVVFVCTYRPVEGLETGTNSSLFREIRANLIRLGASEIVLRKGIDVDQYVNNRYVFHDFSTELISYIRNHTGGHPLFVSQLFSWWEDQGLIVSETNDAGETKWRFLKSDDYSFAIPHTASAVLEERIRLMSEQLRDILIRASIQGNEFVAQVIANVLKLDEYQLFSDLGIIEEAYKLIIESGTQESGGTIFDLYCFAHRFFREHIYGRLSTGQRRILHRQVAYCLEEIYSDNLQSVAGQLAKHFSEANEYQKAASYALMAGKVERNRYAWLESELWWQLGLESTLKLSKGSFNDDTKALHLDLLELSGHSFINSGDYEQALKRFEEAVSQALEIGVSKERLIGLYARLAEISDNMNHYEKGMKYVEKGKEQFTDHSIAPSEAYLDLITQEGILLIRLNRTEEALHILKNVQIVGENLPQNPSLERVRADAYNSLAIALGDLNQYDESIATFQQSVELSKKIGDMILLATTLINQADDLIVVGRLLDAEKIVSDAIELAQKNGDRDNESYALYTRGNIFLIREDPIKAIDAFEQSIALSESLGALYSPVYADLGLAYLGNSELDKAYNITQKGLELAETNRRKAFALDVLGQVAVARSNWEKAIECFNRAIELHEIGSGSNYYSAITKRNFAKALIQMDEKGQAIGHLEAALEIFQEMNLVQEIERTRNMITSLWG